MMKEKAEQYFNKFINEDKLKSKYRGLYHSLEKLPKESIDVNVSEFFFYIKNYFIIILSKILLIL